MKKKDGKKTYNLSWEKKKMATKFLVIILTDKKIHIKPNELIQK